jgi:hypothetical protein
MRPPPNRAYLAALALAGLLSVPTTPAFAKATVNNVSVDINVTVHGSNIGVSDEVIDEAAEDLLEAAGIKVIENGAGEGVVELDIHIYADDADDDDDGVADSGEEGDDGDGKGFIVRCDWDDDEEDEAKRDVASADDIDDVVRDIVKDFIKFIKKSD